MDPTNVTLELEGSSYALESLESRTTTVWYVLDSGFLRVAGSHAAQGSIHEIGVSVNLYPPYIPGLQRIVKEEKALRVG